jgi:capsular exopolysaccharide synthesis family protein
MEEGKAEGTGLSAYLRILRRRRALVLLCATLVPIAAYVFSIGQDESYASSADVLVNRQNLASAITGIEDTTPLVDEERAAETQVSLAETPAVARRTLRATGVTSLTVDELLARTSVAPKGYSDILRITVTGEEPVLARRLAGAYARQFVAYRAALDTAPIQRARREARATLRSLRAAGKENSALFRSLEQKQQELATLQTLSTSRLSVVRDAEGAVQVSPRPTRNAAFGLVLGVVLGIGLALAIEALDTRVRSSGEIGERLRLPLLARLPRPPRKLAANNRLVMLASPSSPHAEAIRMLRANLEFTLMDSPARLILFTSATAEEGKSTTVANLAIALARTGKRIVLVDLDLRRPSLERFFDMPTTPGLTDVALGRVSLEASITRIDLGTGMPEQRSALAPTNGRGETGVLGVLASGPVPPAPGDFIETDRLERILGELRGAFDLVLVDSPPILRVGDAMALSNKADALVVVTRLNGVRRPMLDELRRLLETSSAPAVGCVVTGFESGRKDDEYGFGYRSTYGEEQDASADGRGQARSPVGRDPADRRA